MGHGVPRWRPDPRHRKGRAAARGRGGQAAAEAGGGTARGARAGSGRAARRHCASAVRAQRSRLLELRRWQHDQRGHRSRPRQARRRRRVGLPAGERRGHLPAAPQGRLGKPLRVAAGVGPRRQPVHHAGRSRADVRGAEPLEPGGQDPARHRRRQGSGRQPVRQRRGNPAGDLQPRPPQRAGRGVASGHRRIVGTRARPAGRRRGEHRPRRAQLRLAGDHVRRQLRHRHDHRRGHRQARHGTAAVEVDPIDRAVRHGVLRGRSIPEMEGQPVRRRPRGPDAGPARPSTATASCARNASGAPAARATCAQAPTAISTCFRSPRARYFGWNRRAESWTSRVTMAR